MKKILMLIVVIVSLFAITACGKKSLVGTWKSGDFTYVFNKDKTGSYNAFGIELNFTYETKKNVVTITEIESKMSVDYEYKVKGKTLIIKDSYGKDIEYKKEESKN